MGYEEWIKSLNLPSGVGVSANEAFEAGKNHLQQLWIESKDLEDFAEEVELLIDAEKL